MIIGVTNSPVNVRRPQGITVAESVIRSLLTVSQAAWDAAIAGSAVRVTPEEYRAVRAAENVNWFIQSPNDTDLSNTTNWSVNFTVSYGNQTYPEAVVPSGRYVIGFMVKRALNMSNGTTVTTTLLSSTTSATAGFTTLVAASFVKSQVYVGSVELCFLIKNPASPTAATTWFAHHQVGSGSLVVVQNKTNYPMYYASGLSATPSTIFTGSYPVFQVLATPEVLW